MCVFLAAKSCILQNERIILISYHDSQSHAINYSMETMFLIWRQYSLFQRFFLHLQDKKNCYFWNFYLKRAFIIHLLSRFKVQSVQTFTQSKVQSFLRAVIRTREGTPGRHEPLLFRLEPPRFSRQTKLPLCRPSLCNEDRSSAIQ